MYHQFFSIYFHNYPLALRYSVCTKKAEQILNAEGSQVPNRYVFDFVHHSIADIGLKVKSRTETLQLKKWFGDSKVVNENGKLKIETIKDEGFFFSSIKRNAEGHAEGAAEMAGGVRE